METLDLWNWLNLEIKASEGVSCTMVKAVVVKTTDQSVD